MNASVTEQAASVLHQLQASNLDRLELSVGSAQIQLTHLNKPMWVNLDQQASAQTLTKRQLLQYYASVAPVLLPHLQDRPLTIKRYPQGISGESFIQRHIESGPDFVEVVELFDGSSENKNFLLCQNFETLLWLAEMDVVELHPWYSRIDPDGTRLPTIFINSTGTLEMSVLNYPDFLVFDLDPSKLLPMGVVSPQMIPPVWDESGPEAKMYFDQARSAALLVKDLLDQLGLTSFVKLSGRRGVHIFVPIVRQYPYDQVRAFARKVGEQLSEQYSDYFTTEWQVSKRQGKIFFDFNQNARGKSLASVYSVRPTQQATISRPVSWEELETVTPDQMTISSFLAMSEEGRLNFKDPWKDISKKPQELPSF